MIECNLDDMSPEWLPSVEAKLFTLGALDVFHSPIGMKKGRQGVRLSVLTEAENTEMLTTCILAQTTALGVRSYAIEKTEMERDFIEVALKHPLAGHTVTVKRGWLSGQCVKWKPEYEDLLAVSVKSGLSLQEVTYRVMLQMEEKHDEQS